MAEGEDDTTKKRPRKVKVVVKAGDTLRTLAEDILGDGTKWRELRKLGITAETLEVGKAIRVPRRMVSQDFLRGRFARNAMNADEEYQRVRRGNELQIRDLREDESAAESRNTREIRRTYQAFTLERDRQLQDVSNSWNNRGLGMSGAREEDHEGARSLIDVQRQEWLTQKNDDLKEEIDDSGRQRRDLRLERKEAQREARIRAGDRWRERKVRERATERGLV